MQISTHHRRWLMVSGLVVLWLCAALGVDPAAAGQRGIGGGQGGRGGQVGGDRGGRGAPPRDANQGAAVGTGSITGSVILQGSGTPVRRARVMLTGPELRGGRSVTTDDSGRFSLPALPAGRFMLTASKAGFVSAAYGAKRPGRPGTPIQLADGQQLEKVALTMPRGSVITGIVIDENGEPSPGTPVRALRYVMRTGERSLQNAGTDQTDDRGMYRIYDLQPGEYMVTAVPRNVGNDARQVLSSQLQQLLEQAQAQAQATRAGIGGGAGTSSPAVQEQLLARAAQLQQQLAASDQEQAVAYAPVYYPGTTSPASASSVTLGAGEERTGVDFQLQLVPTAKVEGTVTSADGTLPQGVQVGLLSAEPGNLAGVPGLGTAMTRVGLDGRFSFRTVTPGQYTLQARAVIRKDDGGRGGRGRGAGGDIVVFAGRGFAGQIAQVLWASADVTVNGQDTPAISLTLQPGMTITGRIELQGAGAAGFDFTRVRLMLASRGSQGFEMGAPVPPAEVDANGRFTITGISPGRYSLSGGLMIGGGNAGGGRIGIPPSPAGNGGNPWLLKSAVANGRDVLDFPLEIGPNDDVSSLVVTFSDRTQDLTGTIQDASGQPVPDFTIIVFPSDNRYWQPLSRRIQSSRPGTDGKFAFRNLPAGDYRMTAVTDAEPGEWYDPAFLTQLLPASIPIALTEGEKKIQDIRVAGN